MAKRQCFLLAQDGSFVAQQAARDWWILLQEVDVANDQVEISIAKTVVNERNQLPVTANIRTRSTALAAIPTTVEYKLYNLSKGEQVKGWRSLSAAAQVSFKDDVFPIIQIRCLECHQPGGDGHEKSGLDMRTYEGLMKGTKNGPMITPGNAVDSNLLAVIDRRTSAATRFLSIRSITASSS